MSRLYSASYGSRTAKQSGRMAHMRAERVAAALAVTETDKRKGEVPERIRAALVGNSGNVPADDVRAESIMTPEQMLKVKKRWGQGLAACVPRVLGTVRIRSTMLDDLDALSQIECDPQTKAHMKLPERADGSPMSSAEWLKSKLDMFSDGRVPIIAITDATTDEVIGRCDLSISINSMTNCQRDRWTDVRESLRPCARIAELTVIIASTADPAQHYGTFAARVLMKIAYDDLAHPFVGGITSESNEPALGLMRRLGFRQIACLASASQLDEDQRRHSWQNGHVVAIAHKYGFLRAERAAVGRYEQLVRGKSYLDKTS